MQQLVVMGTQTCMAPCVSMLHACMQAARYGLGALHDGVWYFAFGANLSTRKLTGSRGIEPLEALPGRLDGYHLAFNHRWGAGWHQTMRHCACLCGLPDRFDRLVLFICKY